MKLASNLPARLTLDCLGIWLVLLAAPIGAAEPALLPEVSALHTPQPTRVLFVGNSYFYYNDSLHNHVSRLVAAHDAALGERLQYKSATIGGADLEQHPIDSHLTPGQLGIDAPFQVVILQGGSAEPLSTRRRQQFIETATAFDSKIRATGAETVLYMTHAYVPPHARSDPDMIRRIESLYVETANALDALVIPVGLAFEEAYRLRPELPLHKAFDGSHPSLLGTYLAACVVFGSLYGVPALGNSYDYFGAVDADSARFLQAVADSTVLDFFRR